MKIFLKCVLKMGRYDRLTLADVLAANGPVLSFFAGETEIDERFAPIKDALDNGTSVEIVYQDAGGRITRRRITPLSIGFSRGIGMIEAICSLRNDERNFRLDRILEVK
jgi:predicted DNA-binding transcriptional regulator YafY